MRINVESVGFELTTQLRNVVVSRWLSALGSFATHVDTVDVRLRTPTDRNRPATTICDVAVSLRPSGEVSGRAEDVTMDGAIARAVSDIRSAVEREVFRLRTHPDARHAVGGRADAPGIVSSDDRIAQPRRERLGPPENYIPPVCVREYWLPPGAANHEAHEPELAPSRLR